MKKAFTLSEMLITLVVIGVVGSILIGSIKKYNPQQKSFTTLSQKAQNNIENCLTQIRLNDAQLDDIVNLTDSTGNFVITDKTNIDRFTSLVKKYIEVAPAPSLTTKTEKAQYTSYTTADYLLNYNRSKTSSKISAYLGTMFYTTNGTLYGIKLNGNCTTTETLGYYPDKTSATSVTNTCGAFYIDVNGTKKPNKLGSDQYIFPFDEKFLKFID